MRELHLLNEGPALKRFRSTGFPDDSNQRMNNRLDCGYSSPHLLRRAFLRFRFSSSFRLQVRFPTSRHGQLEYPFG